MGWKFDAWKPSTSLCWHIYYFYFIVFIIIIFFRCLENMMGIVVARQRKNRRSETTAVNYKCAWTTEIRTSKSQASLRRIYFVTLRELLHNKSQEHGIPCWLTAVQFPGNLSLPLFTVPWTCTFRSTVPLSPRQVSAGRCEPSPGVQLSDNCLYFESFSSLLRPSSSHY